MSDDGDAGGHRGLLRHDWLRGRARTTPGRTALIDADDGATWTYAALDAAVDRTAGRLAALGVGADDHLGALAETRPAFVRLVFAAARLGCVLVPLNARLAVPELRRQREVADVGAVVCERDTEADAVATAGDAPVASVDPPRDDGVAALGARDPASVTPAPRSPSDVQVLAFTSGTTGDPKAVRLTTGNLLASAVASAFRLGVDPGDRWLCPLSMYHVGGLSTVLRSTLYGTTTVLERTPGFDPAATWATLREHDCTGVSLVPTMLDRLLDAGEGPPPESLRFVLLGGAPASPDLLERCGTRNVPVHPTYGLTETASQVATARPEEALAHPGTVGRPLLGTEVTIVDEDGEPVPTGEAGELVVRGPTVTPGYYGDEVATRAAFGPRGLHTGDVGVRDGAGRLRILDRRDDRIVTGGENVQPGEVVAALREHSGVRDAAVVGLPDAEWGERVAALVVPEESDPPSPADLRAHLEGRLAGYKRPRTVAFADELPRTASGTVDREAVRERLRAADF